jgi:hypothetical protein
VAGEVNQGEARRLERGCLELLERFDEGQCGAEEVLRILRDYEKMHDSRSDRFEVYAEILRDQPWKSCPCEICKRLGIHVILFRGAERNRRRGFHNLFVFFGRLRSVSGKPARAEGG